MLLGKAEKAGSGVDKILAGWKELGWDEPKLTEEVQPDYVVLTLPIGNTHQEHPSRKPTKKTHQEGLEESVDFGFLQRTQKFFGNNEYAQFERQGKLQARVYFSLDCGRPVIHDRTRQPNQQESNVCSDQG